MPINYSAPASFSSQSIPMSSATNPQAQNYMGKLGKVSAPVTTKQTSGGTKKSSGGSSSGSKLSDLEARVRKGIEGQYGALSSNLKELQGWLPDQEADLRGSVESMAGSNIEAINNSRNTELEKFTGYRGEIDQNKTETLQDLADNTRNLFQAGNVYLGSRGAGNSSATGMYSAAVTQQANKQRADVSSQAGKMHNDLNQKEIDVNQAAQSQIDAVETWKAGRLSEVMAQFQDLSRQLKLQIGQASGAKKAALAKLDADLLNNAITQANQIQSQAASYRQNVSQWGTEASQILSGAQDKIGQTAQYQVGQIVSGNLEGMPGFQSNGDGSVTDGSGNVFRRRDDGQFEFAGIRG